MKRFSLLVRRLSSTDADGRVWQGFSYTHLQGCYISKEGETEALQSLT